MGQDHRPGEKQTGGQGLRQGAGSDSERLWWRLRWVQDRPGRVRQPHERREDRRCQETHWPGKTWQAVRGRSWGFALQCRATRWHLIDRTLAGCRRLLLLAWLLHLVVSTAPGRYYNKEQRGGGGGGGQACTDCTHSGQQTSDWKYFYNLEQQPTPSALCSVRAMSVSADLIYRSDAGAGAVAFTQSLAILIIYEVSTLYITWLDSTTQPAARATNTTKGDTGCDQIPITSQSQYFYLHFWNSSQLNNMTALCKWRLQQ